MTQIKMTISCFGDLFDPQDLTKELNIVPSNTWMKGDIIKNKKIVRLENNWEYSTGFIKTLFFEEVSNNLVRFFEEKMKSLINIKEKSKLKIKTEVIIEVYENNVPSLYLNDELITFLFKLGSPIDFDLYYIDN